MMVGALRRKGVVVRPLGGRLPIHVRVSIGVPPENERFTEALRAGCRRMMGHMRFARSCGRMFPWSLMPQNCR